MTTNNFAQSVFNAMTPAYNAVGKMQDKLAALLTSEYGDNAPSYEQYMALKAELKDLAKAKGLVDDQWMRKPLAAALKAKYGAIPESQDPAAVAKRAARGKSGAKKGAPTGGDTSKRAPGKEETLEQLIARVGVFKVLEICANILDTDASTKDVAKKIKTFGTSVRIA